ncbi:hypothetical protein [Pseudophaeobacter sp.]|uniref:hypothetical protein n=1 Tax=Pseudophaeobacter sp. TaxID=1971739 RepID=UPI003297D6C0
MEIALAVGAGILAWDISWAIQVEMKHGLRLSEGPIRAYVHLNLIALCVSLLVALGCATFLKGRAPLVILNIWIVSIVSLVGPVSIIAIRFKRALAEQGCSTLWFELILLVLLILAVFSADKWDKRASRR